MVEPALEMAASVFAAETSLDQRLFHRPRINTDEIEVTRDVAPGGPELQRSTAYKDRTLPVGRVTSSIALPSKRRASTSSGVKPSGSIQAFQMVECPFVKPRLKPIANQFGGRVSAGATGPLAR